MRAIIFSEDLGSVPTGCEIGLGQAVTSSLLAFRAPFAATICEKILDETSKRAIIRLRLLLL